MSKGLSLPKDFIPAGMAWGAAVLISAVFFWILGDILWHGLSIFRWDFLFTAPLHSGRAGGIGPILISTFLILLICLCAALPIGVGAAVWLSEFTSSASVFGRLVRRSLDVLSGVPSIVFGLFGNALFCKMMGLGFSLLSGGLTLACMILPLFIRSVEEGLRSVPKEYRFGAAALGLSRTKTLLYLLLPAASSGIIVGLVLSIGRAMAETAALIFTSGYVDRVPTSIFDSGRALSIHIFDLSMNVPGGDDSAYKSALVLVVLLLLCNSAAALLTNRLLRQRIT